ncbi:MAG: hypothetical protein AB1705_14135 [Verrucomicrobiota bacterium]
MKSSFIPRAALGLLAAGALLVGALQSQAEQITFAFTALIDRVSTSGTLPTLVAAGDTVSGTYTFESTSPDTRPTRSDSGFYNAVTDVSVDVGGTTLTGTSGAISVFLSNSSLPDNYVLVANIAGGLRLEFQLGAPRGTFANDSLPLTPPDLSGPFFSRQFSITGNGGIFGKVTSLTLVESDTTPPAVNAAVAQTLLWPPNHQMVDVGLSASVSDDQDENPSVQVFVYSSEGDADDAAVGDGSLSLRPERSGGGAGRVYLIVVVATDAAGNAGWDCATVIVPHDKSKKSVAEAAAEAAAAEEHCAQYGEAPAPYSLLGSNP